MSIHIIYQSPTRTPELYLAEVDTTSQLEELALEFLSAQGLTDAFDDTDEEALFAAMAVNTSDHDAVFPDAEAKDDTTFVSFLADTDRLVSVDNVVIAQPDEFS